jgi:hypothetical protein
LGDPLGGCLERSITTSSSRSSAHSRDMSVYAVNTSRSHYRWPRCETDGSDSAYANRADQAADITLFISSSYSAHTRRRPRSGNGWTRAGSPRATQRTTSCTRKRSISCEMYVLQICQMTRVSRRTARKLPLCHDLSHNLIPDPM